MGFETILHSEGSQSQNVGFLSYELSILGKSTDREHMSGCPVMEKGEMASDYFSENGVLFCDDEKVVRLERSDSCTTW